MYEAYAYQTIGFKKLNDAAKIPIRAHPTDAAYDLFSTNDTWIGPHRARVVIDTGIAVQLPPRHVGLVCSRSGLAAKHGLSVINAPGVIDEGYHGELKVILGFQPYNTVIPEEEEDIHLPAGSRVAQLLILPIPYLLTKEIYEFSTNTDRGEGGLGSTGI